MDLIGIAPGSVVADIGAGTGYMTAPTRQRVGAAGKVYANDVQPAMLHVIEEKVRAQQLSNVEIVQGTDTDAHLPDNAIDLALLVDVYHEFSHPQEMLRSIRRSLKTNGRLILVEYRKEDPQIPIAPTHRMSVAEARTEVEAEGFRFDRVVQGLPASTSSCFGSQRRTMLPVEALDCFGAARSSGENVSLSLARIATRTELTECGLASSREGRRP